jgi:hypothetical protein
MLHSRAAARDGTVAQLQFQTMHVVYEIRVTLSTKISAGHCRGARCRCFDMVVVRGWLGLLFHAEKPRAKGRRRPANAISREKCPTC